MSDSQGKKKRGKEKEETREGERESFSFSLSILDIWNLHFWLRQNIRWCAMRFQMHPFLSLICHLCTHHHHHHHFFVVVYVSIVFIDVIFGCWVCFEAEKVREALNFDSFLNINTFCCFRCCYCCHRVFVFLPVEAKKRLWDKLLPLFWIQT